MSTSVVEAAASFSRHEGLVGNVSGCSCNVRYSAFLLPNPDWFVYARDCHVFRAVPPSIQGYASDTFALALAAFHLFTGEAPYEEIMEEVSHHNQDIA